MGRIGWILGVLILWCGGGAVSAEPPPEPGAMVECWAGDEVRIALPGGGADRLWELFAPGERLLLSGRAGADGAVTFTVDEVAPGTSLALELRSGGVRWKLVAWSCRVLYGVGADLQSVDGSVRAVWLERGASAGEDPVVTVAETMPRELKTRWTVAMHQPLPLGLSGSDWASVELHCFGAAGGLAVAGMPDRKAGMRLETVSGGAAWAVLTDSAGQRAVVLSPTLAADLADDLTFWVWLRHELSMGGE